MYFLKLKLLFSTTTTRISIFIERKEVCSPLGLRLVVWQNKWKNISKHRANNTKKWK